MAENTWDNGISAGQFWTVNSSVIICVLNVHPNHHIKLHLGVEIQLDDEHLRITFLTEIYSTGTARSQTMHIFPEKRYPQFTVLNCLPAVSSTGK